MAEATETVIHEDPHAADEVRSAALNPLIVDGHPVHPAAAMFPRVSGKDFDELVRSIQEEGMHRNPTMTPDMQVLDGVSRILACKKLGIPYDFDIYDGDPVAFVRAANLNRRQLKPGQRAAIAEELARLPKHRPAEGERKSRTQSEAAEMMGVSRATVQRVASVRLRGREDLVQEIAAGNLTPTEAVEVAEGKRTKSGTGDEWYSDTPLLSLAREIMDLGPDEKFDFDPASCERANERVRAKEFLTIEDDALNPSTKWPKVKTAWGNFPNSITSKFVDRWLAWHADGGTVHSMQIANAGTADKWIQQVMLDALMDRAVVCFTKGRYKFVDGDGNKADGGGQKGQIVIYRGPNKEKARRLLNAYANLATGELRTDLVEGQGVVIPTFYK